MQHLQPNTPLQGGKYKIVRFLSNGGFGKTYEGVHTMMDTRVAIKEFFPVQFCNRDENTSHVTLATQSNRDLVEKLRKKFNEEAKAVFKMNHPNIVKVHDIFEENGTAYYVMEFIEGKSLDDIVKQRGTLPEAEAVGYIRQVANALKYVHSLNRLHLDIKPGNIMIDKTGKAILIDFGASKHYDMETGENTSTLMGINTPGYAPVEQSYRGFVQFAASTDIYALGATLYKLLTGITPPDAQMLKDGEVELPPLPSNISEPVKNAVHESMRPLRKDRPQSIDDFLRLLDGESAPNSNNEVTIVIRDIEPREENSSQKVKEVNKALYPKKRWIHILFGFAYVVTMLVGVCLFDIVDKPDNYYEYKEGAYHYLPEKGVYVLDSCTDYVNRRPWDIVNVEKCKNYEMWSTLGIFAGFFCLIVAVIMAYYCIRTTLSIQNKQVKVTSWWICFLLIGSMISSGMFLMANRKHHYYSLNVIVSMADTIIALLVFLYLRSKSNVEERWDFLMPSWLFPKSGRNTKLLINLCLVWPIIYVLPAPFGWFPLLPFFTIVGGIFGGLFLLYFPIRFIKYIIEIAKGKR